MEMVSSTEADIQNWRDWDENIGVMGLHVFGFPGSGKSNFSNNLLAHCLLQGDMGLIRGSMNCEWRHFTLYDHKINLLVPEEIYDKTKDIKDQIDCINCKFETVNLDSFDHNDFHIIDHLEQGQLLVIYDAAFSLPSRGWFWADIFEQLVNRTEKYDVPVTFLEHEAGVLFPEIALSESKKAQNHWLAVNRICELFVDFRKNLIRPILISQLASEINHRLRDKCLYTVIKKGIAGKHYPEEVRQEAPHQRVDQYTVTIGKEIYTRYNDAEKFLEISRMWKMVPHKEIELQSMIEEAKDKGLTKRDEAIVRMYKTGDFTQEQLADYFGLTQSQISKIIVSYS